MLSNEEKERYQRQIHIEVFGEKAQLALKNSKVLVIGAGGLGSPILYYLVAAGIGTVGICDYDIVSLSNLNRQILHFSSDMEKTKLSSALNKLHDLNPHVKINTHQLKIEQSNIQALIEPYDVIVDAVDNITTRLLITDACFLLNKICIEGAVSGMHGTLTTILPHRGPCYRCLYPRVNEINVFQTRYQSRILGAVAGTLGSLQAIEVIKLCANLGVPTSGRLLIFDGLSLEFESMDYEQNPQCPLCGINACIKTIEECGHQF